MEATEFRFVQMTQNEILELPALLNQRLPKAAQIYNNVQISFSTKFAQDYNFFRYNGLGLDVTCFASSIITDSKTYWIILAPNTTCEKTLGKIMSKFAEIVDWSKSVSFNAVDHLILKHLFNVCDTKYGFEKISHTGGAYTISIEEALGFTPKLSPGQAIRYLREEDKKRIFENWKFASETPDLDFLWEAALKLGSVGVEFDGKLVSWGLNVRDGAIHIVHTREQYRGQGFAKILMCELCRITAATGRIPVVQIEETNETSKRLMHGVGFKLSHAVNWTEYVKQ